MVPAVAWARDTVSDAVDAPISRGLDARINGRRWPAAASAVLSQLCSLPRRPLNKVALGEPRRLPLCGDRRSVGCRRHWSGPHNVRAVSDTAGCESDASSTQFAGNKAPPLVEERPVDDNSVELALRGWLASFAHDRALARSIALIAARLTLSERS